MIRIALPNKGALSDEAVALVREAGYRCRRTGRELSLLDAEHDVEFVFLRPRDIAVYVQRGVLELGVTGRDLNEDAAIPAKEVMALGFGKSSFYYAVPQESRLTPEKLGGLRIACSYSTIVKRDLARRKVKATIVPLDGAVEISIKLGVADAIADVVESGQTLREAGLKTVGKPVMESEAIVIAKDEATARSAQCQTFLRRLQGISLAREYAMIEYDIARDTLAKAQKLTPGIESPTVMSLTDPAWVAVKAMHRKKGINGVVDALAELGARGIVVSEIRTCRL
ncbi:MAG: ATP phosphoribosyltransferase [Kiritimatiellaeota bacterium]|nr:ATP phosphoribosyltransferase [Kiritimatiellota bacterium]